LRCPSQLAFIFTVSYIQIRGVKGISVDRCRCLGNEMICGALSRTWDRGQSPSPVSARGDAGVRQTTKTESSVPPKPTLLGLTLLWPPRR
jgi:hypothetical protein